MHSSIRLIIIIALVAGAAAAAVGSGGTRVDLSAVREIWGSVVRDADHIGLRLTRVSDAEEMRIGDELARSLPDDDRSETWTPYVAAVGSNLTPYVRRKGIHYAFIAVNSEVVNAFALPGGHIAVTTGMLKMLRSDAELAAVLGHEIAHVDRRHCIERFQYQIELRTLGLERTPASALVAIRRALLILSYTQDQEIEADEQGLRLAIRAGYDPEAAVALMTRLAAADGEAEHDRARTPLGEVGQAVGDAVGTFGRTHPSSLERRRRLAALVERARP